MEFSDERRIKEVEAGRRSSRRRLGDRWRMDRRNQSRQRHFPNSHFGVAAAQFYCNFCSTRNHSSSLIYKLIVNLLLHGGNGMQAYPSDLPVGDAKNKIHSLLRRFKNCLSMKCGSGVGPTGVAIDDGI